MLKFYSLVRLYSKQASRIVIYNSITHLAPSLASMQWTECLQKINLLTTRDLCFFFRRKAFSVVIPKEKLSTSTN